MSILGSGLDFPYQPHRGKLKTVTDAESVEAAVRMLFATRKGTRFMLPAYGSDVPELVFEPADQNTAMLLELYAREAIQEWIPRIQNVRTVSQVDEEEGLIRLRISYTLRQDPTPRTMVYPLYVQRG